MNEFRVYDKKEGLQQCSDARNERWIVLLSKKEHLGDK